MPQFAIFTVMMFYVPSYVLYLRKHVLFMLPFYKLLVGLNAFLKSLTNLEFTLIF
jgi:hypothetical protein